MDVIHRIRLSPCAAMSVTEDDTASKSAAGVQMSRPESVVSMNSLLVAGTQSDVRYLQSNLLALSEALPCERLGGMHASAMHKTAIDINIKAYEIADIAPCLLVIT